MLLYVLFDLNVCLSLFLIRYFLLYLYEYLIMLYLLKSYFSFFNQLYILFYAVFVFIFYLFYSLYSIQFYCVLFD